MVSTTPYLQSPLHTRGARVRAFDLLTAFRLQLLVLDPISLQLVVLDPLQQRALIVIPRVQVRPLFRAACA
jgi:hypothetical protein